MSREQITDKQVKEYDWKCPICEKIVNGGIEEWIKHYDTHYEGE